MSNINFFRVLQSGGFSGGDEPFNIDFSCNNSTTVNLTDFSSTYSSSANFNVFAANTSVSSNSGSYLYVSKYTPADDPDQMIQQFEYNRDTSDNLAFPKIDDMTASVKGEGTKIFRIDSEDTITGGFPVGGNTVFGFKEDIIITGNNSQQNPSTTLVIVHGFKSIEGAQGFSHLLREKDRMKIAKPYIAISSENYQIIQIHKNLDMYLKDQQ